MAAASKADMTVIVMGLPTWRRRPTRFTVAPRELMSATIVTGHRQSEPLPTTRQRAGGDGASLACKVQITMARCQPADR